MNKLKTLIAYFFAVLTIIAFIAYIAFKQASDFSFEPFYIYRFLIVDGIKNTILVSLISLVGSLVLGFILYLLQISKIKYFNALIDVFTEIIYGTPLLVLIIVMAFLIGPAFDSYQRNFFGVLALIIYMSPYMKNVFKSAFSSISEEQYLAMDLFGFTAFQRYRYIIIPQVIRILMPPLMNNFSLIIKGSALLNLISYAELYYVINVAQSRTFAFVEGYILMWVLYLLITIPLSQLTKYVERKWAL
ncbi:MAG: amino acid ABC transporter permease [Candidatus Izemoplasmatales bacterium]|nr:amino acid ABC transporter permease [Candidatus Izemoplasmatales bacterium]